MNKEEQREQYENYSFEVVGKLFDEHNGDLSKLSDKEREVVRLWRLEADMYNGGFLQFFCNWGEENHLEACAVLQKINAPDALAIINESAALVSLCKHDDRIKSYSDIYIYLDDHLTEEQIARLNELDELYWENPDDVPYLAYQHYCCQPKTHI